GINPADGSRQFPEALRVIKQGLTTEELTFSGEFYNFKKVPMVLKPVQRPHPPLWYGVLTTDAAYWAALEKAHIVTLLPPDPARAIIERYRLSGKNLADRTPNCPLWESHATSFSQISSAEAVRIAERAYRPWLKHMELLWV